MRKLRTRQHVIEDLGINHLGRQVLLANCTLERYRFDYGYDAFIATFNREGEIESGYVHLQIKSTDKIKLSETANCYKFDLETRDLESWLFNNQLVFLVLYDAKKDVGFYLDVQDYFRTHRDLLKKARKFIRVYFPVDNIFNARAVGVIRKYKNQAYGIGKGL